MVRLAVGLMSAMNAAGDRAGGIRHARAYQALIHDELGASPEPRVKEYEQQLLREPARAELARKPEAVPTATPSVFTAANVIGPRAHLDAEPARDEPQVARKSTKLFGATAYLAAATAVCSMIVGGWLYANRSSRANDTRTLQPGRVAVAVLVNRTNDAKLDAIGLMHLIG
ncbi:MAG: hypothetical protein ABJB66_18925 [Gemmatimonadaceae bacterium]